MRSKHGIFDAAASHEINIVEGFRRFSAGEFAQFLSISRGSLEETIRWVQDGIDRGYFTADACRRAFEVANESGRITAALHVEVRNQAAGPRRPRGQMPPKPPRPGEPNEA